MRTTKIKLRKSRMKNKNTFLKVLKERYLSLMIVPVLLLSGLFVYARINGIIIDFDPNREADAQFIAFFLLLAMILFSLIKIIKLFIYLFNKRMADARVEIIAFLLTNVVYIIGLSLSEFTQKIENFANEKQYYLRSISTNHGRDAGEGDIGIFPLIDTNDTKQCGIIYDGTDTLLIDPNHRGIGEIEFFENGGWSMLTDSTNIVGSAYKVPTDGYRIEAQFYYMCFDFDKKIEIKKYKTKEEKK